mmetsp:Transcript_60293/g.143668  ORF Transcript_60293/g.143668 Transcript_60293/m.143668 type:complete len:308 (-) Transcript_60293:27-950(-)
MPSSLTLLLKECSGPRLAADGVHLPLVSRRSPATSFYVDCSAGSVYPDNLEPHMECPNWGCLGQTEECLKARKIFDHKIVAKDAECHKGKQVQLFYVKATGQWWRCCKKKGLSVVDVGATKPSATSFATGFGNAIRATAFRAGPLPLFLDRPIFGMTLRQMFYKMFGPRKVVCEPMDESGGKLPPTPAPFGETDSARRTRLRNEKKMMSLRGCGFPPGHCGYDGEYPLARCLISLNKEKKCAHWGAAGQARPKAPWFGYSFDTKVYILSAPPPVDVDLLNLCHRGRGSDNSRCEAARARIVQASCFL